MNKLIVVLMLLNVISLLGFLTKNEQRPKPTTLHYANQAAFMSDNRQTSNGDLFSDILKRCLWVLPLREWVGYWQGNHRSQELIGMTAFSPEEISQAYFKNLNERIRYEQELLVA